MYRPKLNITEIAEAFSVIDDKDEEEQIRFLKLNECYPFKKYLYLCYSDKVEFLLPEEIEYIPSKLPMGMNDRNLAYEAQKMYIFTDKESKRTQEKRTKLYTWLLEGLALEEAEFLENVRKKNLGKRYGLTLDIIKKAYPDLGACL